MKNLLILVSFGFNFYLLYYCDLLIKNNNNLVDQLVKIQSNLQELIKQNEILMAKILHLTSENEKFNSSQLVASTFIFFAVVTVILVIFYFPPSATSFLRGEAQAAVDAITEVIRTDTTSNVLMYENTTNNMLGLMKVQIDQVYTLQESLILAQQELDNVKELILQTSNPNAISTIINVAGAVLDTYV
jgi:hypothetical protein